MDRQKIFRHFSVIAFLCFMGAASPLGIASAAIVANDGGITLWVSWDDLDDPGKDIDEVVNEANSALGGFNCTPTNSGRSALGAPSSPASSSATCWQAASSWMNLRFTQVSSLSWFSWEVRPP